MQEQWQAAISHIYVKETSSLGQQTGKASHGIMILVVKYLHIVFLYVDILIHSVSWKKKHVVIGITNVKSVHNTDTNAGRLNGNKSAFKENTEVSTGVSMKQLTLTCTLVSSYVHKKGHWCVQPDYVYTQVALLFLTAKLVVFQRRVFKHNQQEATLHNDIYYYKCSTCFRRFLRPSSGTQNYIHSIGYLSSFTASYRFGKKQ